VYPPSSLDDAGSSSTAHQFDRRAIHALEAAGTPVPGALAAGPPAGAVAAGRPMRKKASIQDVPLAGVDRFTSNRRMGFGVRR